MTDTLLEEYGDEIRVYRSRTPRQYDVYKVHQNLISGRSFERNPRRYWVHAKQHYEVFDSGDGFRYRSAKKRALAWAAIVAETGSTEIPQNENVIPIPVAKQGKAYIASYMFAAHNYSVEEIADDLEVTRETTRQYIRDVIQQRR